MFGIRDSFRSNHAFPGESSVAGPCFPKGRREHRTRNVRNAHEHVCHFRRGTKMSLVIQQTAFAEGKFAYGLQLEDGRDAPGIGAVGGQ
jgi:hypothetical protein